MTDREDKKSRDFKIKRYLSDEVKMVLFICATDLNGYHIENLEIFAECIEGRIEVLLTAEYLNSINSFIKVQGNSTEKLLELKIILQEQYSGQWSRKMITSTWKNAVYDLAHEILGLLGIEYQEPLEFMENHFEVDWI